jgi:glutamate transport system substrate-binding protein
MRFSRVRRVGAIATALAIGLTLSACGGGKSGGGDSGTDFDSLVIGIKYDQPGLGQKVPDGTEGAVKGSNGSFKGFDVDVATYVANELGVKPDKIEFVEAKSADREKLIQNDDVDFIVASYSITDERKQKVRFAGPYFIAHQDLLLRADDNSVPDKDALKTASLKLCSVTGSTSAQNVKDDFAPKADLKEYKTYSQCLPALESKSIDALTTDDTILAGYAAQPENKGKFKLAGLSLSDENYGIGLAKNNKDLQKAINDAIKKMIDDGKWKSSLDTNLGPAGYKIPEPPQITETS